MTFRGELKCPHGCPPLVWEHNILALQHVPEKDREAYILAERVAFARCVQDEFVRHVVEAHA